MSKLLAKPKKLAVGYAHQKTILRIVSALGMLFGVLLIPPLIVSLFAWDGMQLIFTLSALMLILLGYLGFSQTKRSDLDRLKSRDGFLIVTIVWLSVSFLCCVPLLIADLFVVLDASIIDILFESVSGLTTTGATTILGLNELPASLQFYRQWLQWIGGIGIVVLAVAIMPLLGVGGAQIYKAEAPGPFKDARIAPKISDTAKVLFLVYLGLTIACGIAYFLAGMTSFDAMLHALTTVATGGFSNHDASIGYFDSDAIKLISTLFMLLGGTSYALHYVVLTRKSPTLYMQDEEAKLYIKMLAFFSLFVVLVLFLDEGLSLGASIVDSLFHVTSFMTSTGYVAADLSEWPLSIEVFLFLIAFIGGCQGSSSGGMKVVRIALMLKQARREVRRLIHPQGVFLVRLNGRNVQDNILAALWGFLTLYIFVFGTIMLLFLVMGHDLVTAFAMSASMLNNTGPGIGGISDNFVNIDSATKMICIVAMILGRLEIFTILILFIPRYWRR